MIVLAAWWLMGAAFAFGQQWSVKNNLLSDVLTVPSLGYAYASYRRYDEPRSRVVTRRWYVHYFCDRKLN